MLAFIPLIGEVIKSTIGGFLAGRERKQELAKVRVEADLEVYKAKAHAKIQRMQTAQEADIAWDNNALENAGWKDEWFTVLLSIPLILCFIPGMDVYVRAGFTSLEGTPEWYQAAFGLAIAASFGMKKFTDYMGKAKGA